tara:strand:- start:377 stop:1021 length:645 start_codon:yes stop_codon:yes gene_type:complete
MNNFLLLLSNYNLRFIKVDEHRLFSMVGNVNHQGVVAQINKFTPPKSLTDLLIGIKGIPLILVLDGVNDPHNLGACLRVADGAGVDAIIAPKDKSVGLNSTVIKVASGAADSVPYISVTNLSRAMDELKEHDIWLMGTCSEVDKTIYDVDYLSGTAFIIGAEGFGLRRLTKKKCDHLLKIPMTGSLQSLNVAVASGVCLYEACRQRIHNFSRIN